MIASSNIKPVVRPPFAAAAATARRAWWGALVFALAAAGCASTGAGGVATNGPGGTELGQDRPTAPAPAGALRAEADRLWQARLVDDWATMFQYEDLSGIEDATLEQYVEWSEKDSPFKYHSCTLGRVLTDGPFGWVELDVSSSARRFPGAPVRTVQRWQVWELIDGRWRPVPDHIAKGYPVSPALRDLDTEPALRARCDAFWRTRGEESWAQLVDFCEPADREQIEPFALAESQGLLKYVSHEVRWVEATGDQARTSVHFVHKLNDPSLTKAPPMALSIVERWVKVDGEWYIDLVGEAQVGSADQVQQETTP